MVTRLKQEIAPRAAALLPMKLLRGLVCPGVVLPYYHLVTDEPAPHVENLYRFRSVREFTDDLEFFLQHFEPVSVEDLLRSMEGRATLPARSFLLSFDDGFREMHDVVAPILLAKGAPAVFFLNSAMHDNRELCFHQKISLVIDQRKRQGAGFPEVAVRALLQSEGIATHDLAAGLRAIPWAKRALLDEIGSRCGSDFEAFLKVRRPYLDSEQVRAMMRNGFEIGGHSVDHPLYSEVGLAEQLRQTRESMAFVREKFAPGRKVFAFPHMDRGVTREFFQAVHEEGTVEITFGTSGPAQDCIARSFQRFSMEKTALEARAIFARNAMKALRSRATGSLALQRN